MLPSNGTLPFANVTEEERRRYLADLHETRLHEWWPTVVFLIIVATVGLFGNSLVLRVFYKKIRRDATDFLIMAIASCYLVTNVIATPVTLYNILSVPDSDFKLHCQLNLYLNGATTLTSILLLLAVTICRYKKICKTLIGQPISVRSAKICLVVIVLTSAILLIPVFHIFEHLQTRPTEMPDIYTKHCYIDQDYLRQTAWPLVYALIMLVSFVGILVPLIVLNVLLSIKSWRHSKIHGVPMVSETPNTFETTSAECKDVGNTISRTRTLSSLGRKKIRQRSILTRTSLMMIVISAVYIISILPMVVIVMCYVAIPRFYDDMPAQERRAYHLMIRFYFINSGTNVIIYSLCDTRFRGVLKFFSCRKCKTSRTLTSRIQKDRLTNEGTSSKSGIVHYTNRIDTSITEL